MKEKNGFTLIELLAIIVILAIIAVITVPIILNIIENSRKGAATDSAYGYKDAVNKYYVQELANNNSLKLQGTYTVSNGTLSGDGITNVAIPVSGDKPSSGKLRYSNNVLNAGCLVIGDYKITFKSNGSIDQTEKGDCTNYEFPVLTSNVDPYSMDAMCPGCIFINYDMYPDEEIFISNASITNYVDYTEIDDNSFLGFSLNGSMIQKAYVCGQFDSKVFCLEDTYSGEKVNDNLNLLKEIFPNGTSEEYATGNYYFIFNENNYINLMDNGTMELVGTRLCSFYVGDGSTGCFSS